MCLSVKIEQPVIESQVSMVGIFLVYSRYLFVSSTRLSLGTLDRGNDPKNKHSSGRSVYVCT